MTDPRSQIDALEAHYHYDSTYIRDLLDASPETFGAFAAGMKMSSYRDALPLDAHFVARVAAMMGQDCGACAQLNIHMALEAGVSRELLALLVDDPATLPEGLREVALHAQSVAANGEIDEGRAESIRARYGAKAFAELAVVIAGSQLFPTAKRALLRNKQCAILRVELP
ncbi:MAG: hypothetical protein AAGE52_13420 [Myxococcota bacterium]